MPLGNIQRTLFNDLITQFQQQEPHSELPPDLIMHLQNLCESLSKAHLFHFLHALKGIDCQQYGPLRVFQQSAFYKCFNLINHYQTVSINTLDILLKHQDLEGLEYFFTKNQRAFASEKVNKAAFLKAILNDKKIEFRAELFHYCMELKLFTNDTYLIVFQIDRPYLFLEFLKQLKNLGVLNTINFRKLLAHPRIDKLKDAFDHIKDFIHIQNAPEFLNLLLNCPELNFVFSLKLCTSQHDDVMLLKCLNLQYVKHMQKLARSDNFCQQGSLNLILAHQFMNLSLGALDILLAKASIQNNPNAWWNNMLETIKLLDEHQLSTMIPFVMSYNKPFAIEKILEKIIKNHPGIVAQQFMRCFAYYENQQAIEETFQLLTPKDIQKFPFTWRNSLGNILENKDPLNNLSYCCYMLIKTGLTPIASFNRIFQSHFITCLSVLQQTPSFNDRLIQDMLCMPMPYDLIKSLKMLVEDTHSKIYLSGFLPKIIQTIALIEHHQPATRLIIELYAFKILNDENYAKILTMILALEPSDSFESLKISFFNQLLDDQASLSVKEILCLHNSHQLLDYKAYFSQILLCTERLKLSPNRLDVLYIIARLNRQHIHVNLLNECINALIDYPDKSLLKEILEDLAQKQIQVTATSLMYMIHQENHSMLITGLCQKSAVLSFNLNIFINYLQNHHIAFENNFSNIHDYDHEQLYSLTSNVFKQISLESPHSSGLMGWLSMCFEKELVNIHNITEIMSCAFPEQYLLALQNLIATNAYLNSPQQIFKTFLGSAQPQMLVEIIYLCQHNALFLSPQRLEIFNKRTNLMDIHQFMSQIFRKKIFHKPQSFIEFLAKFLNLKFSDELMPHIELILETVPAQEFEFFMVKLGESSKRFLILEVLQKVKEFQQPINMVNTLFHCQSENLENLLQFINTYQQLNVKIIERFAQSSFDYQYTLKELNLLIDSEYVDINDYPTHIQIFKITHEFDFQLFLSKIEKYQLVSHENKKEFLKKVVFHQQFREINALLTFITNCHIDLNSPSFNEVFHFFINSVSPFDAARLYMMLHEHKLLGAYSLKHIHEFMNTYPNYAKIVNNMDNYKWVLQNSNIKSKFLNVPATQKVFILKILYVFYEKNTLALLLNNEFEESLVKIIRHPNHAKLYTILSQLPTSSEYDKMLKIIDCPQIDSLYAFLQRYKILSTQTLTLFSNPEFNYSEAQKTIDQLIDSRVINTYQTNLQIELLQICPKISLNKLLQVHERYGKNYLLKIQELIHIILKHPQLDVVNEFIDMLMSLNLAENQTLHFDLGKTITEMKSFRKKQEFFEFLRQYDPQNTYTDSALSFQQHDSSEISKLCDQLLQQHLQTPRSTTLGFFSSQESAATTPLHKPGA